MRKPTFYLSLHDVPLDLADGECDHHDGEMCCPDEPLDKVMNYIPVLDDALLEALGIDCSTQREAPAPAPEGRNEDGGAEDMDVDVVMREVESTLGAAAGGLSGGVPELAATMPDSGLGTCTAPAGFVSENGEPSSLPARALPCSMPPTSITPSYRNLPTAFWETASLATPEPVSPFQACTVPRKPRRRPVAVHKRPWSVVSPYVPAAPATHDSHDNNNGNDGNVGQVSYGNGGGRRRSVARQRNRQQQRTCGHCHTSETPQWRAGPDGAGSLCNACGIRYKMGNNKLLPEYRPSTSPSFRSDEHSNRHRKVVKLREKKEKALKVMAPDAAGEVQRVHTDS